MSVCCLSTVRVLCWGGWLSLSFIRYSWVYHEKLFYYSPAGNGSLCMFDSEPLSRLRGNIKSPKAEWHNHEAVASGLIFPLCSFHPHQSCTCFMVIFTGSWLLSHHRGTPAAAAYNTIWPSCHIPAVGVWASGGDLIHTVTKEDPPPITLITSTPK